MESLRNNVSDLSEGERARARKTGQRRNFGIADREIAERPACLSADDQARNSTLNKRRPKPARLLQAAR